MYLIFALASAICSALTAVLSKLGLKNINSHAATFFRTGVVLIFVWLIVFITGAHERVQGFSPKTLGFLLCSGLAGGGSWLCYFKALQMGRVSQVAAVDKSSIILTILMGILFLNESAGAVKFIGLVFIAVGTYLMLERRRAEEKRAVRSSWFFYAAGSAVFAALTAILAKIGLSGIDANLGTALRTSVIFVFAGLMLPITNSAKALRGVRKKDLFFLGLSGAATGAAWLCYFQALQLGEAGTVAALDKLSIVFTVLFSRIVLRERVSKRAVVGLVLLTVGTLLLL